MVCMKNPARWPGLCRSMQGIFLLLPDPFVNLLPVYRHLLGCGDSDSGLITLNLQESDFNVVTDVKISPDLRVSTSMSPFPLL